MTPTAAIAEAASQVRLYRQGRDWIVSVWDEPARAWRADPPTSFWAAQDRARRVKIQIALEALGVDPDTADHLACTREGSTRAVVRSVMRERSR